MKNSFLKRIVSILLSVMILTISLSVYASGETADTFKGEKSVVILHTNDMHGALVGSSSIIGADKIAALKSLTMRF